MTHRCCLVLIAAMVCVSVCAESQVSSGDAWIAQPVGETEQAFIKKQQDKLINKPDKAIIKEIPAAMNGQVLIDSELDQMYVHPDLSAKKVTLNVRDADTKNVIDMIGRAVNINFVVDPVIAGKISSLSVKDCNAGQALKLVCSQAQPCAAAVKSGDVWQITTREQARSLLKNVLDQAQIRQVFPIVHAQVDDGFSKRVKEVWTQIVPEGSGSLHIDDEQRKIFARANKQHLQEFGHFLTEVDQPVIQVRIDVIIVLASEQVNFDFGVDWSGIYNRESSLRACGEDFGLYGIGATVLDFPEPKAQVQNPPNSQPNAGLFVNPLNFAINLFNSGAKFLKDYATNPDKNEIGLIRIPFIFGGPDINLRRLNMILNMAEVEEKVRITSRPSILTGNNRPARILVGESIPLQTVMEDVTGSASRSLSTVNYKDTGVTIEVTPQVSKDLKSVFLNVFVEDSAVIAGSTKTNEKGIMENPPVLAVIRAKNQVMLKDGQTTIVGGLTQQRRSDKNTAVPFVSKIPILGAFFKASFKADRELERYIFITPTIVVQDV